MESHPDKGGSDAAFQRVREAFDVARRHAGATPPRSPPPPRRHAAAVPRPAPAPAPPAAAVKQFALARSDGQAQVFRCRACGEAFPSERRLKHHVRTEHAPPPPVADDAAVVAAAAAGTCAACGWKRCQCSGGPVLPQKQRRPRAASAPDLPAVPVDERRMAWFARAHDRLSARSRAVAMSPAAAVDDIRSATRVRNAQVSILRDIGFTAAVAETYADPELSLDAILDVLYAQRRRNLPSRTTRRLGCYDLGRSVATATTSDDPSPRLRPRTTPSSRTIHVAAAAPPRPVSMDTHVTSRVLPGTRTASRAKIPCRRSRRGSGARSPGGAAARRRRPWRSPASPGRPTWTRTCTGSATGRRRRRCRFDGTSRC